VAERDLSVVVFGPTGVTGRLAAAYLAERAEEVGARWAAAGRDAARIGKVLGELGVSAPETVAADAGDQSSLQEMAERARVVLNVVGPYTLHGEPVIEACIAAGTHYLDLTGEVPFIRRMIDRHHEEAERAGVKVVNMSGFEALPPDLLVLLAADTARERWGEGLVSVDLDADLPPPGRVGTGDILSGGTLQSAAEALADPDASMIADPAALLPDAAAAEQVRRTSPISLAPRFDGEGNVISPMLPAPFANPGVIHRTAALLAAERGEDFSPFRYREGVVTPGEGVPVALRYLFAGAAAGMPAALRGFARARPSVRHRAASLMRRSLPSSGFGPSGEGMESWHWNMTARATTVGGHHVEADLDADGHPGYLSAGRMIAEAGLLLAEDGTTPDRSGFLTPATALGSSELDRFGRAGLRFSVSS
jgi:short subunit dehydrogenase-like uncharacterized protein